MMKKIAAFEKQRELQITTLQKLQAEQQLLTDPLLQHQHATSLESNQSHATVNRILEKHKLLEARLQSGKYDSAVVSNNIV